MNRNIYFSQQTQKMHILPHRLAIADDRTAWFEAIRDPHDRLLSQGLKYSSLLTPTDFLSEFPPIIYAEQQQNRLHAMKLRVQQFNAKESHIQEDEKRKSTFIKGLLA